jgi:Stress responsive A/B Barrel Domain
MIEHIVLFQFKPSAQPGEVVQAGEALLAMKKGIPEVKGIHFGPNLGPSAKEYSHVLIVRCEDMGAVRRYLDHPVHRQTVDRFIAPIRDARLAVDLEV